MYFVSVTNFGEFLITVNKVYKKKKKMLLFVCENQFHIWTIIKHQTYLKEIFLKNNWFSTFYYMKILNQMVN